jgi:hypothetical protein
LIAQNLPATNPNASGDPVDVQEPRLNQHGEWEYETPYDRPFDLDIELVRNGTTQNYRSLHLQRLANPTLPWNPPPVDEEGNENKLHQVNLPINPYLTIDSQSVDLTAFNGASELERTELPTAAAMQNLGLDTGALLQGDYFAPLSASEYKTAPDHVVQGLINELVEKQIIPQRTSQWVTVDEFRDYPESRITTYLNRLEDKKGGNAADRAKLLDATNGGEWAWHRLRRVLPDDRVAQSTQQSNYSETNFKQRLHMKSQERGGHHLRYDFDPSDEGWEVDPAWEPRLLWKQERPNVMLIFKTATGQRKLSDLKNVWSRRVVRGDIGPIDSPNTNPLRDRMTTLTQDERDRGDWLKANLKLGNDNQHVFDYVLEQTLGFVNEAYAPNLDRSGGDDAVSFMKSLQIGAPEVVTTPNRRSPAAPEPEELTRWNVLPRQRVDMSSADELVRRQKLVRSTFPWLAWNNRPFVSSEELLQVPGTSSSLMLRYFSVFNANTRNPYNGATRDDDADGTGQTTITRYARQLGVFGHLLNFFNTAEKSAGTYTNNNAAVPFSGAPHFYRILEYVDVPSRYVGTETRLAAEFFNDVMATAANPAGNETLGTNLTGFDDPRYNFQPPFNTVPRFREPGRVNLNTVTGRRTPWLVSRDPDDNGATPSKIWSEVYDGIMHRERDGNIIDPATGNLRQLSHFGPAWRDVVLSRRGYAQFDAGSDDPVEKPDDGLFPDVFASGLNPNFPTMFANPFRTPDAGDLVPLPQMVRYGVDAGWLRAHHFDRGDRRTWGSTATDDNRDGIVDDTREAGFGGDELVVDPSTGALLPIDNDGPQGNIPLFSETFTAPFVNGDRNSAMMYQPMSRLGNLVTNRSGVFAVWITVGYFEVKKAPPFSDANVQARFGGDGNANSPATRAALALYNRVYPDGYMLGREVGSDTGDVKRPRGFYIIDRTEEVGFKPGEDLNVEKTIRLRRRID